MIRFIAHFIIMFILCSPVSPNVSRIYKDHFQLFISITSHDFLKKEWLCNSRITPIYKSNLTFNKTCEPELHITTLYAQGRGFHAPVLAFIVKRDSKD